MANRAYLYSPEDEDYLFERGDECYDSRWNIPLLWFPLFNENSLAMLSRDKDGALETFLIENKDIAIERFLNSISKVKSVLDISITNIEEFIENIKNWEGNQLVLAPWEIIQDEGEDPKSETIKDFSTSLKYLSNGEISKYIKLFEKYAGSINKVDRQDPQDIQNYLIGFTYW